MKRILFWIGFLFIFVWGLVQNIVGIIYLFFRKKKYIGRYRFSYIFEVPAQKGQGSVTLGNFICLSPNQIDEETITHEYGHVEQGIVFGPFYLLIIGISSLLHASIHDCSDYYHFFTEKWAEKNANKGDREERLLAIVRGIIKQYKNKE